MNTLIRPHFAKVSGTGCGLGTSLYFFRLFRLQSLAHHLLVHTKKKKNLFVLTLNSLATSFSLLILLHLSPRTPIPCPSLLCHSHHPPRHTQRNHQHTPVVVVHSFTLSLLLSPTAHSVPAKPPLACLVSTFILHQQTQPQGRNNNSQSKQENSNSSNSNSMDSNWPSYAANVSALSLFTSSLRSGAVFTHLDFFFSRSFVVYQTAQLF